MSYVVSIRREVVISEQELIAVVDGNDRYAMAETDDFSNGSLVLCWKGGDQVAMEYFVLHRGEIAITSPSNSALEAAKSLAAALDANIVGEEGDDLTDVDLPEDNGSGCGPFVWAVLGIGGLLVLYWIIE